MRFEYLTPHQFSSLQPFVDTLLISTFTAAPLDVALPHAASMFVSEEIHQRIKSRLMGRVAELRVGASLLQRDLNDLWFESVAKGYDYSFTYGIVIVDRTLRSENFDCGLKGGMRWFVADWWQWLRTHVPPNRLTDALMYLSLTNQGYRSSGEFRQLGLSAEVVEAMTQEGARLLDKYVERVCEQIVTMWSTSSTESRESK